MTGVELNFKSQLYVEDLRHQKPVLNLPDGLSKPGERAYDRNEHLPWVRFKPITS